MLLIAYLPLAKTSLGIYDSKIGIPGAGGILSTITLGSEGEYHYRNRGCFTDKTAEGRFEMTPGFVTLHPPTSFKGSGDAWTRDWRFRIVPFKGSMYLVEEKDRDRFAELAQKGKLEDGYFFVKA